MQSLRALTIRHLQKNNSGADDDNFSADGVDLGMVTFVGKVVSAQGQYPKLVVKLDDGTSAIECTSWSDDEAAMARKRDELTPGIYARVYGTLKTFAGRISVTAFAIKPVTDHNEVTYHMLQCIMQHLHLTKGAPPQGQAAAAGGRTPQGGAYGGAPPSMTGGAYGSAMPAQQPAYGRPAAPGGTGGAPDLNTDVKTVFNMEPYASAPQGATVQTALEELQRMGRNYTYQQVNTACDYLAQEGVLYSTVNDHTYKTTGSG